MNKTLHNNKVFYTLAMLLCALGAYVANLIEDWHKMIAIDIVGLVVPYLIYLAFLSPKNITDKKNPHKTGGPDTMRCYRPSASSSKAAYSRLLA